MRERFNDFKDAINVLKHGEGRSYDRLLKRRDVLPFKIRGRNEAFFQEGDVSEVATLIRVDDNFVMSVATVVREVFAALEM